MSSQVKLRSSGFVWFCRLAATCVFAMWFKLVSDALDSGDTGSAVTALVFGFACAFGFLWATRMGIDLDDNGVVVIGYFNRVSVAWSTIEGVSTDYDGLHLHLNGGYVVTSSTLGKSNISTFFGIQSDADRRVELIQREFIRYVHD